MTTTQQKTEVNQSSETRHVCDCCGCDLNYSHELHCATCHRELWTPALDEVHCS